MKPRILVVDDNETSLELLATKLEAEGYEVEKGKNGLEGLEKAEAFHPDLIMLDIMMPRMDGYEVCRRLKAKEETRYIPIVMLTARTELEDKMLGLELGAEDYMTKPYSLLEVSARVKSLLRMRELQKKLRDSEKMAALGEMAGGIAHEVRNPLVTIGGLARRLHEHQADEEHRLYAQKIIEGVERLERMCKRIDEYMGILVSNLEHGDINTVITNALEDMKDHIVKKDIDVVTRLTDKPVMLNMDPTNLKIAICNIVQNSIDAINGKGEIRVGTELKDGTLLVSISDNGCGMEEKDIRKIFHPFHTSKMKGAGLGLTISYRIIHDHGGDIKVASKKGEGTTITISLPIEYQVKAGA
jgi:signal transduction histidine kinase